MANLKHNDYCLKYHNANPKITSRFAFDTFLNFSGRTNHKKKKAATTSSAVQQAHLWTVMIFFFKLIVYNLKKIQEYSGKA